jgi:hypothetical protein
MQKKVYAKDCTIPELIAVNIARQMKDYGQAHIGFTRGAGRSFTYIIGIPMVAVTLAKRMGYAPNYYWIDVVTFNRRIDETRNREEMRSPKIRSEGIVGTWPNLVVLVKQFDRKITDTRRKHNPSDSSRVV